MSAYEPDPILDLAERAALEALATLTVPLPDGWVVITPEVAEDFDHHAIAYGVINVDGAGLDGDGDYDWADCLRWDGWPVVFDEFNVTVDPREDVEPFATAPPEVLAHVLGEGARKILDRIKEQG